MARILIVDDDEMQRVLVKTLLEKAGHEVELAENGEEAYRLFLRSSIDVVVTDLHMPDMNGLELIRELRALYPKTALIAMSGTGVDQLGKAAALGAMATLPKPLDRDRLVDAVDMAVRVSKVGGTL